jgi:hypothetical protein
VRAIAVVAMVFVCGLAFMTLLVVLRNGLDVLTVLSLLVLVVLAFGIFGALGGPPDRRV